MMTFAPTPLHGSFIIHPERHADDRGWFMRYYCKKEFQQFGHEKEWVQMNQSVNYKKGTLRGMHYQLPPYSEIKLVKCVKGAVYDVIIDVRKDSKTFLQWFGADLTEENKQMMYIPAGFAHGFQCLTDHCELLYHHSEFYLPGAEGGLSYKDPKINISWPEPVTAISDRDLSHPFVDEHFKGI